LPQLLLFAFAWLVDGWLALAQQRSIGLKNDKEGYLHCCSGAGLFTQAVTC
jgi:hypothetical protein